MSRRSALLMFAALLAAGFHENQRQPTGDPGGPPSLVVAIVVDQMRADYLDSLLPFLSPQGFRRLMDSGARFTRCAFDHVPTFTAPGHSVILSGIMPGTSGIVANEWIDVRSGRSAYCVEDSSVTTLGLEPSAPAGRMSPRNFLGTTICDGLLDHSPSSKAVSISLKDRAAILLGGKHPTGAFWFDPETGNWISSSYYGAHLPDWVEKFNARKVPESFLGGEWIKLLPANAYPGRDSARGEENIPGERSPVFPHHVNDLALPSLRDNPAWKGVQRFDALLPTPFGNDLTIRFAEAAMSVEHLGRRGVTDILAVSFSSTDYCGHLFGPDSHEIRDIYLRLDRQVAGLLAFIDSTVGLSNTTLVLTADHGVAPLPEQAVVPGASRISPTRFVAVVRERVGKRLGYDEGKEHILRTFTNDCFYFDTGKLQRRGFGERQFEEVVAGSAVRQKGIARSFTRAALATSIAAGGSHDPYQRKIEHGFDLGRSGNVFVVPRPGSFFSSSTAGTTHGTGYEYDCNVPLLFFGKGIRPGKFETPCAPNDIAPTIAALLGIRLPEGCVGRCLVTALIPF